MTTEKKPLKKSASKAASKPTPKPVDPFDKPVFPGRPAATANAPDDPTIGTGFGSKPPPTPPDLTAAQIPLGPNTRELAVGSRAAAIRGDSLEQIDSMQPRPTWPPPPVDHEKNRPTLDDSNSKKILAEAAAAEKAVALPILVARAIAYMESQELEPGTTDPTARLLRDCYTALDLKPAPRHERCIDCGALGHHWSHCPSLTK